jgi:hypothetical protein
MVLDIGKQAAVVKIFPNFGRRANGGAGIVRRQFDDALFHAGMVDAPAKAKGDAKQEGDYGTPHE